MNKKTNRTKKSAHVRVAQVALQALALRAAELRNQLLAMRADFEAQREQLMRRMKRGERVVVGPFIVTKSWQEERVVPETTVRAHEVLLIRETKESHERY